METQPASAAHRRDARLEPTIPESTNDMASKPGANPALEHAGPTSQRPGSIIANRYVLQGRVGRGRIGEVYHAIDQSISEARGRNHRVTIELITSKADQAHLRERLTQEFVGLLSISHPNITRIMDFGVDGATSFFTTESLEGASLRFLLDQEPSEPLSDDEVLALVGGLAQALRYAHAKGFVHGDVGTESVFVTRDYEVKLTDLASAVLARTMRDSRGMRAVDTDSTDPSEDVLGLAWIAYELLWHQHPRGEPPRIGALRGAGSKPRRLRGVPGERWRVLARALEPRPEKRTLTVAEFAKELGVTGSETLVKPRGRVKGRGYLRPVLWIGAPVAIIAWLQPPYTTIVETLDTWRMQVVTQLNPASSPSGSLEASSPEHTVTVLIPGETAASTNAQPPDSDSLTPATIRDSPAPAPEGLSETTIPSPESAPRVPQTVVTPEAAASGVEAPVEAEPSPAPPVATSDSLPGETTTALALAFAEETLTVSEGDGMASVTARRLGGRDREAAFTWWTTANTTVEDDDYAALGPRTEVFAAGQESHTVYVPLVSDALREAPESFFVYVAWTSSSTDEAVGLEVIIVDDDSIP